MKRRREGKMEALTVMTVNAQEERALAVMHFGLNLVGLHSRLLCQSFILGQILLCCKSVKLLRIDSVPEMVLALNYLLSQRKPDTRPIQWVVA